MGLTPALVFSAALGQGQLKSTLEPSETQV